MKRLSEICKESGRNLAKVDGEIDSDVEFIVKIPYSIKDDDAYLIYERCKIFVEQELPLFCRSIKEDRCDHMLGSNLMLARKIYDMRRRK